MLSEGSIAEKDHFVASDPDELEVVWAGTRAREIIERTVETAKAKEWNY